MTTFTLGLRIVSTLLFVLLLSSGQLLGSDGLSDDETIVRSGEQFGFCVGYCFRELEVDPEKMILSTKSNPYASDTTAHPSLQNEWSITSARWDSLISLVDQTAFLKLDEVYGCPDCADGGSEWIDISFPSGKRSRVTFEYGSTIAGIDELVSYTRKLRREAIERAAIVNN